MFAQLPAILLAICSMLLFTYREQNRVKRYNDDIAALRDAVVKQQHINLCDRAALRDAVVKQQHIISDLQKQVEMSVKVGPSGYVFGEGLIPALEVRKADFLDELAYLDTRDENYFPDGWDIRPKFIHRAIAQIDEDIKWRKENPTILKVTKSEYLYSAFSEPNNGVGLNVLKPGVFTMYTDERFGFGPGMRPVEYAAIGVMEDGPW